jgi:hypothetical protein
MRIPADGGADIPARRERDGEESLAITKRYGDYTSNMLESLNVMLRKVALNLSSLPCNDVVSSRSTWPCPTSGG